ncbi:MAG: glycosyltransferase family 39 protein [Elusimicrobia bacterium]|nr:glycosyltransferase family 39 protein [Elusimicrobiota bacterium]
MKPRLALFLAVLAVWAFLHRGVLVYIFSNPACLGPGVLFAALQALGRLAFLAWLLAVSMGLGRLALKRLRLDHPEPAEEAVLSAGLGLGLLSYLLFLCGLLHLWRPAPLAVLLVLLTALAWTQLRGWRLGLSAPGPLGWGQALFALPVILAALYGFASASAPPTEWDSLAVHLELPKLYAQAGGLAPLRWLSHGFDPMAVELLYVPAMVFQAPELAAMVSLLFQGLMAAALWVFGSRLGSRPAAAAAVALFLAQPAVINVSGTPGTDFGVGLFAMLAFWSAWRAAQTGPGRWLGLSGACAGLAAVSKTTGVFLAAALAVLVAYAALRRPPAWRRWALGWAAAAALASVPWFLRTYLYTGNPVWPYLPALFGGDLRDLYIFMRLKQATLEGVGTGWPQLLLLPFHLVFRSAETFRHSSRELLIPLLVLAGASWRAARQDPFARWTLAYAGLFTVLWFQAVQNWRYFIPLMPWLCLLACLWAQRCLQLGGWRRAAAGVLVVGFWALPELSANNALFPALGLRPRAPGQSPQEAYLSRSVGSYAAMVHINRTFPPDARVLLYREVRPFYLDRQFLVGDPQNEMLIRYEELAGPEELYQRLRGLGLTAVLWDPRLQTFSPRVPGFLRAEAMMQAVLRRYASDPVEVNGVRIYSWRET